MTTVKNDPLSQPDSPSLTDNSLPHGRYLPFALPILTWKAAVWLCLTTLALLSRFWNLGQRVMSHDESLHVFYSWDLAKGGGYIHNPMMHGPLLFELTALFDKFFGANDFASRIVPALFGVFIVIGIPFLLRRWLGQFGAFATSVLFLVSPYVLFYSRYNRHDIEEIGWVLVALISILSYQRARENGDEANPTGADRWLLILSAAVALMFSAMETAFFYMAIFASFLLLRLFAVNGFHWRSIRQSADFDLLVVLTTMGAFFSSPIALLLINPLWTRLTGQPFVQVSVFNTYGVDWAAGITGIRIWGLMACFWLASLIIGYLWGRTRWLKLAGLFLFITLTLFTTFYTNKNGIGTGFIGSLGYWLSQQGVARGSQPGYYYFIVFPLYEYLPLIGGIAALLYFIFRARLLKKLERVFVALAAWWGFWIFVGLSAAGEKMPWLSTHITVPFILLTGWLIGKLLLFRQGGVAAEIPEDQASMVRPALVSTWCGLILLPFALLLGLTIRTSYLVNYVNYDFTTEFIDYAHGGPGVKWLMEDVDRVSAWLGQGNSLSVAYDGADSWPLAWYLRDHPGYYGDQPNKATLLNSPIVVAGAKNWDKVDVMLGADYSRYEVARIWWPMEDYKGLTWKRIRGFLTDPKMRQAVWNIVWARDYTLYWELTKQTVYLPPKNWPLEDRMRIYIRKDVAAQFSDLALQSSQIADFSAPPDLYASKKIQLSPIQVIQPANLNAPRNLAFAPDGSVYVADSGNARILHLDAQGKLINEWGSLTPEKQAPPAPGTFNEPWGITVDAQGNVYVADTWNHRIQKFTANGEFITQWGTGGVSTDGPDRFWGPRAIAAAPDGNLYVTDTGNKRVAVFTAQGQFLFDFTQDGDAQLNEPVGIAINQAGQVYVVDTWNMRVVVFDLSGKLITSWPVQAWNSTSVNDKPYIAIDSANQVYLTDPEAGRVLVFSDQGKPLAVFGEFGQDDQAFNLPTGITRSPQGNMWIVEAGNNRLDVYPFVKP
jgi:uncharacterized protein (TIGR03663 family)